jgi:hypothetical protein
MESETDKLLSDCGAVLEVDTKGNYFLKMRSFPLTNEQRECDVSYVDTFYHQKDETSRKGKEYYRTRLDCNSNESKTVKQTNSKDLNHLAHCYKEEKFTIDEKIMSSYMSYAFQRWCITQNESADVQEYVDKVTEPVEYSIKTLRVKLNFDPTIPESVNELREMIKKWGEYSEYPVYTKFMLVLQCSPSFDLYEELFSQYDPSHELVTEKIGGLLNDSAAAIKGRDYIWFVNNQIYQSQLMFDMDYTEESCYDRLRKLRPRGNQHFSRNDEPDF